MKSIVILVVCAAVLGCGSVFNVEHLGEGGCGGESNDAGVDVVQASDDKEAG